MPVTNFPLLGRSFPCHAPFTQLYVVPRATLDLRFCPYHAATRRAAQLDQDEFFARGPEALVDYFENDPELERRREEFIAGNYVEGSGCSPDCYWYSQWKAGGQKHVVREIPGSRRPGIRLRKLWLSVGPDCNMTCRYCLDPKEFVVNYGACRPEVMEVARDFVASGGDMLLTGGEPFLPKYRFLEALEVLAKQATPTGRISVHTNATLLDERARSLLLRAPMESVEVSMDTFRRHLFEHLRRGGNFDEIWGRARALRTERDKCGQQKPRIIILCAVMVANHDQLIEIADTAVSEGMEVSFNTLFKAYFSPDFCRTQGLYNLNLSQLDRMWDDLLFMESRYGLAGPVQMAAIKGQVANLREARRRGRRNPQVALASGGEAPRRRGIGELLRRGDFGPALRAVVGRAVHSPKIRSIEAATSSIVPVRDWVRRARNGRLFRRGHSA